LFLNVALLVYCSTVTAAEGQGDQRALQEGQNDQKVIQESQSYQRTFQEDQDDLNSLRGVDQGDLQDDQHSSFTHLLLSKPNLREKREVTDDGELRERRKKKKKKKKEEDADDDDDKDHNDDSDDEDTDQSTTTESPPTNTTIENNGTVPGNVTVPPANATGNGTFDWIVSLARQNFSFRGLVMASLALAALSLILFVYIIFYTRKKGGHNASSSSS